ncbi:MAG: ABC transporter substrate-binding protein [Acidobacteriota bacterium]
MKRLLVLLAACGHVDRGPQYRAAGNPAPRDGGTLHIAIKDQVSTLDPTIEYDEISGYEVHALFDTLVGYDPASTRVVPHLAERWDISADALTYTFWLRDGLAYSDGTPVVAADFAYSLERARTTADSPFGSFLADVAEITAPSARELVIRLSRRNAALLEILAMTFATPQRADHVANAGDQLRREPLGTGPFLLASWDEGQRMVLARNPHYWDAGSVHLDAIEIRENIPRDTQFLMFERGELDTIDRLAAPDYLWVIDQPAWQPYVHHRATLNAYGSRMNVRDKPFDDRRVRQALNYALDKSHTIKLLQGAAVASHGILPPGMFGRDDSLAPYPHDPAKARALLAEAGYPDGFDVEYVIINDEEAERIAGSLQADLAQVGVRVHVTEMAFATFYTAIGSKHGPPFSIDAWLGDYPDPTNFFDTRFHSRAIADVNSQNDSFYANPELDALLDAARGEPDAEKREAMYHRAERILYDDAPWLWNYHQLMTEVTQPYVKGYEPHPIWTRDYSHAWLDLDARGERVPR